MVSHRSKSRRQILLCRPVPLPKTLLKRILPKAKAVGAVKARTRYVKHLMFNLKSVDKMEKWSTMSEAEREKRCRLALANYDHTRRRGRSRVVWRSRKNFEANVGGAGN
jgi:hypothetical protein